MKHLKEYLAESAKKYAFKIKIAGDVTETQEQILRVLLDKYRLTEFKKASKTPIQALPLDFPKLQYTDVTIYECELAYPTTQFELTEYVGLNLRVPAERIVVRRVGEPSEEYQEPKSEHDGPLLTDSKYSEAPNAKFEDYYGDKYNMNFVKELNATLKAQRKARGEQIPGDEGN